MGNSNEVNWLLYCPVCCEKEFQIYWENFDGWDVVKCKTCGFIFVNPQPTLASLEDHYSNTYLYAKMARQKKGRSELNDKDHEIADKYLKLIHQCNPDAMELCDIGCSFGYLLAALREHGFNVKGYELSSRVSAFAQKTFNLDVVNGVFQPTPNFFDVVIMSHVLEHVTNPGQIIHDVALSLRKGGLFILVVPNTESFTSKLFGRYNYGSLGTPPEHLFYFSSDSISKLLRNHNLMKVHMHTETGRFINFYRRIWVTIMAVTGKERKIRSLIGEPTDEGLGYLSFIKPILFSICDALYWLTWPLWKLIDNRGYGDVLWVVSQK